MYTTNTFARLSTHLLLIAVLLAAMTACGGRQHRQSLTIPLTFQTERAKVAQFPPANPSPYLRLYIAPVEDARTNKNQIGENIERMEQMGARPIYATGSSPAEFVHDVVTEKLAEVGFHLVNGPEEANRILNLTLHRFYVVESSTYQGEARITWQVSHAHGQHIWQGQTATMSRRFGRSLSATNYNQSYSDATVRAVRDALQIEEFQEALAVVDGE